jgi:hypothetical protein
VSVRRLAIAVIVAICLGAPVVEMFDQWDHTLQDGNDTEADLVVAALCVGVALSVAGIIVARIRALSSSHSVEHHSFTAPNRFTPRAFVRLIPTGSPPTPLRI